MKEIRVLIIFYLLLLISVHIPIVAQTQNFKFGKPTKVDLQMTEYAMDKDAEAAILYEYNKIWFEVGSYRLRYVYEHTLRIKILNDNGVDWAKFTIPFHNESDSKDEISELKACVINMENGEIYKKELTKDSITSIWASAGRFKKEFTIDNANVGTIIDVKYKIKSDYIGDLPSIDIQHPIPVTYSYYSFCVPKYLSYNEHVRGSLNLSNTTINYDKSLTDVPNYKYNVTEYRYEHQNIPAIRKADYVHCMRDHLFGFDYELSYLYAEDRPFEDYNMSWQDLCSYLDSYPRFGKIMRTNGLFSDEISELKEKHLNDNEIFAHLLRLVQKKVKWNGRYSITTSADSIGDILKTGVGNSADMNFLLYCALRDMGYQVFPVMLNPRHMGMMPEGLPTTKKINAFILMVKGKDTANHYIDATDPNAFVDVIPPALLVNNAHYFFTKGEPTPIDLTKISKNQTTLHMEYSFYNNGKIAKGFLRYKHNNINAYCNNLLYNYFANEKEYIEDFVIKHNISTLTGYNRLSSENAVIVEDCKFEKDLVATDSTITVNPFLDMTNILYSFKDKDRQLPVELDYPTTYNIISNISIPSGWTISELPKSTKLEFGNNDIQLTVQNSENNGLIISQVKYSINKITFTKEEYPDLVRFYDKLAEVLNQNIMFRKK